MSRAEVQPRAFLIAYHSFPVQQHIDRLFPAGDPPTILLLCPNRHSSPGHAPSVAGLSKMFFGYERKLISPCTLRSDIDSPLCAHDGSALPGASGGPIITVLDGEPFVIGIHLGTWNDRAFNGCNHNVFLSLSHEELQSKLKELHIDIGAW